jgi:hypothetical protein
MAKYTLCSALELHCPCLVQVSWIVAPTWRSEHATNHPADGEDFTAKILQAFLR